MQRIAYILAGFFASIMLAAVWLFINTGTTPLSRTPGKIMLGGKNFTEQLLLTEMTAQLLRTNGFAVDQRAGMGSKVVRDAQVNGQIDIYWEYTGTSLITYNKIKDRMSAEEAYEKVKELDTAKGLTWLSPSEINSTYALAVRKANARTDKLKTLSDLANAYQTGKQLKMAVNAEFSRRPDGLPGLKKTYGFKMQRADIRGMMSELTYRALNEGFVDVALVFATDARVKAFNFRILKDDKHFFPDYAAVPVVRTDTLKANPKLAELLNALSVKLDDAVVLRLNTEVDIERKPVSTVAEAFLKSVGLK
jgi:osmoprotectant transport system substrate-binding protein